MEKSHALYFPGHLHSCRDEAKFRMNDEIDRLSSSRRLSTNGCSVTYRVSAKNSDISTEQWWEIERRGFGGDIPCSAVLWVVLGYDEWRYLSSFCAYIGNSQLQPAFFDAVW